MLVGCMEVDDATALDETVATDSNVEAVLEVLEAATGDVDTEARLELLGTSTIPDVVLRVSRVEAVENPGLVVVAALGPFELETRELRDVLVLVIVTWIVDELVTLGAAATATSEMTQSVTRMTSLRIADIATGCRRFLLEEEVDSISS